jgi:hypothetical protein
VLRRKLWATAQGKLQIVWRRGNPESRDEEERSEPPGEGKLEPFGLGETPVIWWKKALSHRQGITLAPPGLGETPACWQRGKPWAAARGTPSHPVIWSTGTPGAFLASTFRNLLLYEIKPFIHDVFPSLRFHSFHRVTLSNININININIQTNFDSSISPLCNMIGGLRIGDMMPMAKLLS